MTCILFFILVTLYFDLSHFCWLMFSFQDFFHSRNCWIRCNCWTPIVQNEISRRYKNVGALNPHACSCTGLCGRSHDSWYVSQNVTFLILILSFHMHFHAWHTGAAATLADPFKFSLMCWMYLDSQS